MTPSPSDPFHWLQRLHDVRRTGDRRASAPLLAVLLEGAALDEDTLDDVTDVLCGLEDARTHDPLLEILLDRRAPDAVRRAALRVLGSLPVNDPSPERVQEWIATRDPIVRAYGASFLEPVDGDRLAALVRDVDALVRRAAAESLVASARTPALVDAVRSALRDPDAIVREIGCRAALFDEPLAATYDLLHLLDDDDADVRAGVYDVLEDYPGVAVVLALADARSGPEGALAESALELLVRRVAAARADASPAALRRIDAWAAPIRWLLDEPPLAPDDETGGDAAWEQPPSALDPDAGDPGDDDDDWCGDVPDETEDSGRRPPVNVVIAERVLRDADAAPRSQRDALVRHDWTGAGARGLGLLIDVAGGRAWNLRHGVAVSALDLALVQTPGAADLLLRLAADVEAVVRRIALHALTHVRDVRVVAPALVVLGDPRMRPLAGDSALQAVATLAKPAAAEAAIRRELAEASDRDGLLLGAIHLAERLELGSAVPDLRRVAEAPVVCGVAQHVAALRALRTLEAQPPALDLRHLEHLDHLDVQAELGAWDWHDRRYG